VLAGRRSEIDFLNGLIATKGEQIGIATPVHRALTSIVKGIERGELTSARENILALEV
jgi:2-dehydropantoate 2-reductase